MVLIALQAVSAAALLAAALLYAVLTWRFRAGSLLLFYFGTFSLACGASLLFRLDIDRGRLVLLEVLDFEEGLLARICEVFHLFYKR